MRRSCSAGLIWPRVEWRRHSADLDFFSAEPFDEGSLLQSLKEGPGLSVVARSPHTAHITIEGEAVSSRGTRRDFVDVYVLAKEYGLRDLLSLF